MIQWLRNSFVAGFFVMVPLIISIVALVWVFGVIDGFTAPIYERLLGRQVPGLGIVTTAVVVLMVGTVATNVIGKRILQRGESYLLRVPVFRTVYAPVKQLVVAFSPDNASGFKRVVLIQDAGGRSVLGFLTKEFSVDRGNGPEALLAVYVPTNHIYLGDVVIFPRAQAVFPDISVEEGIHIFLTGGMALPSLVRRRGAEVGVDVPSRN
jgi:uncharacterized membrane protein